jgi:hypothetical protein
LADNGSTGSRKMRPRRNFAQACMPEHAEGC